MSRICIWKSSSSRVGNFWVLELSGSSSHSRQHWRDTILGDKQGVTSVPQADARPSRENSTGSALSRVAESESWLTYVEPTHTIPKTPLLGLTHFFLKKYFTKLIMNSLEFQILKRSGSEKDSSGINLPGVQRADPHFAMARSSAQIPVHKRLRA